MIAAEVLTTPALNESSLSPSSKYQNKETLPLLSNETMYKPHQDVSEIVEFYKNKNLLVTGGSGFLGKVLIYKLIDSCPDIGKIYVLIRSKKGLSAETRLIQMLKAKPFCFKYQYADLLKKIVAIESDIVEEGLGLNQTDRILLQEQVNIVLHSAASVKFDAPLKDNLRDNVYGTRSIVALCKTIKNLQAFVHVSTAYSNCQSRDIAETILPLDTEVDDAMRIIESLPSEACEKISDTLLEGRPNTYTYTKAMAEHFVAKEEGNFPISIVRPSIIISSAKEPCPGWVDNVNGIAGLGCLAAIGLLRDIDWNYYATSDMVPVDFVANCIICAAYKCSVESAEKMLIYNMTSGNMKPISWGVFFEMLRNESVARPSGKVVRPIIASPKHTRANSISFALTKIFSELIFAYMVDMILTLIGYKKLLVKITQKMHNGYKVLMPFTTNQWNFESTNVINLADSLSTTDKNLFQFDMRNFNWSQAAIDTWDGARLLLLKEEASEKSYKFARSRLTVVTFLHYAFMSSFISAISYIVYSTTRAVLS